MVVGVGWLPNSATETLRRRPFREAVFANFRNKNIVFLLLHKKIVVKLSEKRLTERKLTFLESSPKQDDFC